MESYGDRQKHRSFAAFALRASSGARAADLRHF